MANLSSRCAASTFGPLSVDEAGDFIAWANALDLSREEMVDVTIGACLRAIAATRGTGAGFAKLGELLYLQRRYHEAAAVYTFAIDVKPNDPLVYRSLGDVYRVQGRLHLALAAYTTALELSTDDPGSHYVLGLLYLDLRDYQRALVQFRSALAIRQDQAHLHVGVGKALLGLGDLQHAYEAFQRALAWGGNDLAASRLFASTAVALRRMDDAIAAWIGLGNALVRQRRFAEAGTAYRLALSESPKSLEALLGVARAEVALGQPRLAVHQLHAAITSHPDSTVAHVRLGMALHQIEELEQGWNELGWYFRSLGARRRSLEQPPWNGTPLQEQTVFLWADEQYGDKETVLFLRYTAAVRRLGGRVIVGCSRALLPLLKAFPHIDGVTTGNSPAAPYDVQAPLPFLPALVPSARAEATSFPYLSGSKVLQRHWGVRLRNSGLVASERQLVVGVAWAGTPGDKLAASESAPLPVLAPLGTVPGVRFVSLQLGPCRDELRTLPATFRVESVLEDSCSLADVAAIIANLSLVISTNTTVAHLAGALGQQVWLLLSRNAGWPWPAHRNRTVWYPSMRLFRQTRQDDWADVVDSIRMALLFSVSAVHSC